MEAVLSEILDRLQDIDDAWHSKEDNTEQLNKMFDSLCEFVSDEEDEAGRIAWLKSAGVL